MAKEFLNIPSNRNNLNKKVNMLTLDRQSIKRIKIESSTT